TPRMAPQLRRVAAATREHLLDLAADQEKLNRNSVVVRDGKIVEPNTKKSFDFGHITKGKKIAKAIGQNVTTSPAGEWKIEGKSVPKVDGRSFVTGSHKYASDIHRPGMLFGKM